jgi:hypothetical protein
MILQELKDWINKLPDEFLEFSVVNGEYGELDGEFKYRVDKPVTALTVDTETKEIVILNETAEEIPFED